MEDVNKNLINVDEYMSDNESIYSIRSMEVFEEEINKSDSSDSGEEEFINEIGLEKTNSDYYDLVNLIKECEHEFKEGKGLDSNQCCFSRL